MKLWNFIWVFFLWIALFTPSFGGHENCGCEVEYENGGVKLLLHPNSGGEGFLLYVGKSGPKLEPENQRRIVEILDQMLDHKSAKWPKTEKYLGLRFSVDLSAKAPYMIARRQKHDYTVRIWLTRDQMEELWAVAREHAL